MVLDVAHSFFSRRSRFHLLSVQSKDMAFSREDIIRIITVKRIVFVEKKEQILRGVLGIMPSAKKQDQTFNVSDRTKDSIRSSRLFIRRS